MFKSIETVILENIVLSVLVVGSAFALRWAVEFAAVRKASGVEARRRRFAIRSVANILLALALLALWMSQIQTVVFSLAAVMVALVIATKELIMCAAGAILRFGGHLFRVGDRIEVAGLHGEVIDHGLFSTTVMELPRIGEGVGGHGPHAHAAELRLPHRPRARRGAAAPICAAPLHAHSRDVRASDGGARRA